MSVTAELHALCWPLHRVGDALEALARAAGLDPRAAELPDAPDDRNVPVEVLDRWITDGARWLGVEAEAVQATYGDAAALVRDAGPALLRLALPEGTGLLLLLGPGGRAVPVLTPDLRVRRVAAEPIRAALCDALDAKIRGEVDALLDGAGVPARRRPLARREILTQRLAQIPVRGCWMLRLPPGASFVAQARRAGLPRRAATLLVTQLATWGLGVLAWWIIGAGALNGNVDRGMILAWALILVTMIPLRLAGSWASGRLALELGALFKQRLLLGALRTDPEAIRQEGSGQLLGRVIESEALESLALSSGFVSLASAVELVLAGAVLLGGAGAGLALGLFALCVALALAAGAGYYARLRRQADTRLAMTHDLVERMVGQRTRIAQESPARWHDGEDPLVARYLADTAALDAAARRLTVLVPRGWLVLGLVGLAPAFVATGASAGAMAVGVGGVLMAYGALRKLLGALTALSGAAIAWRQVRPLFDAATRREAEAPPVFARTLAAPPEDGETVLDAHGVVYRYNAKGDAVLRGATLRLRAGDRVLLEGGSGGGKSTLGSVLSGLRVPEAGLLLLRGLDRSTLGDEGWRRRVVSAPQFHENHVFSSTFAFNLLMGAAWPPRPTQLAEAEALCHELDLGPLLARMPAGLEQVVGETGWQLSHGERSRLFIARALLQGADLAVLDESFAALDPETLQRCLACVLRRARTVMIIAHP